MMSDGAMMNSGQLGWMMGGMGLIAVLAIVVLVLALFSLIKYLRS